MGAVVRSGAERRSMRSDSTACPPPPTKMSATPSPPPSLRATTTGIAVKGSARSSCRYNAGRRSRSARAARPVADPDAVVASRCAGGPEGAWGAAVDLAVGMLGDPAATHGEVAVDHADQPDDAEDDHFHGSDDPPIGGRPGGGRAPPPGPPNSPAPPQPGRG